jgi:hypothetical protein
MRASLGCHLEGAARPVPDTTHAKTLLFGNVHRFARETPLVGEKAKIRRFVLDKFIPYLNLQPLDPATTDMSLQYMLDHSHYSQGRKDDLVNAVNEIGGLAHALDKGPNGRYLHLKVKQHMKDEAYPEFKHGRCINAREDIAKAFYGRFIRHIENIIYTHPYAIKHIPVDERAAYMTRLLGEVGRFIVIDHTSLEAHVVPFWMEMVHLVFESLTANLEEHAQFAEFLRILRGKNYIENKNFSTTCLAKRMSGEMDTSVANLLLCMIALFYVLVEHCGADIGSIVGVGEGDDSVTKNPTEIDPTKEMFEHIGFTVKMELHTELSTAGFCQMYYDPEDCDIVTDPRKVLADFGYCERKYALAKDRIHMGLLRAKSLSLAYQYPGCPIIGALASYGLRITAGYDASALRHLSHSRYWKVVPDRLLNPASLRRVREKLSPPKPRTRFLFEKLYGIDSATQLNIESYLGGLTDLVPLTVGLEFHPDWIIYFSRYSVAFRALSTDFVPPSVRCLRVTDFCLGKNKNATDLGG